MDELLASVTEDLLEGDPQHFQDNSLRVERILLEMVRTDPVQPRLVLPEQLHTAFHSSRLTPTQALKELVRLVQVAARQRGRPFANLLELLPDPERDESDTKRDDQLLSIIIPLGFSKIVYLLSDQCHHLHPSCP
jgi:hypothetical protein